MKKALLCVSFGTSVAAARESIRAVEEVLQAASPDRLFARAFTSTIIRRILAERGEKIPGVAQALEELWEQGITDVTVQPTHILYGNEYDKIREEAAPWRDRFETLRLGRPLLADAEDLQTLAKGLSLAYPPREGETLVLFGHGTDHFANAAYPALQTAFRLLGREDVLVGTVEGWPDFQDVRAQLKKSACTGVHLAPLMLVAGDHALHDMAGGEESWKAQLEAEGYAVRCTLRGLGTLPAVQDLYRAHLERVL